MKELSLKKILERFIKDYWDAFFYKKSLKELRLAKIKALSKVEQLVRDWAVSKLPKKKKEPTQEEKQDDIIFDGGTGLGDNERGFNDHHDLAKKALEND